MQLVDKHMTLIQNIIHRASQLDPKQNSSSSVSSSIIKPDAIDWNQLASTILQHPVFLYWYQWMEVDNEGGALAGKTAKEARAISAVVNVHTLRFLTKLRFATSLADVIIAPFARKTFLDLKTLVETYYASEEITSGNSNDVEMEDESVSSSESGSDSDDAKRPLDMTSGKPLDQVPSEVGVFILLSSYVDPTILADVILTTLKQPDVLLEKVTF